MKTDLRVRFTKKIIKETFLELLKSKPLNKITVKEICEKAEINRGTFYKHYYDTYDLMEQLENEAIENFENLFSSNIKKDTESILLNIINFIQENNELFATLYSNSEKKHFLSRLSECCTKHISPLFLENSTDEETSKNKLLYYYISGGTTSLIEQYLAGKLNESPESLAKQIEIINLKLFS